MERKSILKNNKGGGLILVIGCVALLSLVGAMLLVVTTNNRKMKDLESRMQQSFYGAESGSGEMVSQLEVEAEDALKRAFADLMAQYSLISDETNRNARYAEFFQKALEEEVTQSDAAATIMRKALGLNPGDALDVDVNFGSVTTEAFDATTLTSELCIQDASFTYTTAGGSQTTIKTDIRVKTKLPNVTGSMSGAVVCDFSDFAIMSGENIVTTLNTTQHINIGGNFYTRNSLVHSSDGMTMNINNAKKLLVGNELQVTNNAKLNINGGTLGDGEGVWTTSISVSEKGELTADTNFYVSDDLTISGTGAKAVISGDEYIGYSGGNGTLTDPSAANSAITINTAKDITLDFSGTKDLILTGNSYIHDALWGQTGLSGVTTDAEKEANKLGVLQGESMAYKDMQSMYLVPGNCLITGHNPMTKSEYDLATAGGAEIMTGTTYTYKKEDGNSGSFELETYLSSDPGTKKYVARHVKLDGGATEFVYLYLNFRDEAAARQYFVDYMAVDDLRNELEKQLSNLGNSTIELAEHNYTLASAFRYNSASDTYGIQGPTTNYTYLGSNSLLARRRSTGLFTYLRKDASATTGAGHDVISNYILKMDKFDSVATNTWIKNQYEIDGVTYDFWVFNGDIDGDGVANENTDATAVIETDAPTKSGIILVNGDLALKKTSFSFNGLVLATGNIDFNSDTTITANSAAVEALLTHPDVKEYFHATGGSSPASPYLSSEAVSISFENWQRK